MKRSWIGLLVLAIIVLAGVGLWSQRLWFFDSIRLFDYTPPPMIAQLASEDTMTAYSKHLFYVYHPTLEGSTQFNQNCKVSEQAIVLGCTVIGQGIYLYSVNDPQLNGVEQVTAAHEMLHVAYSRLSSSERTKVDSMVMSTYNQLAPNDPLLRSEEQSYLNTEGAAEVPNELHSVLGTEIANLPPALEAYYNQYFTNRQAIVNYANDYEAAFTSRQQQVSQDDQQLTAWQQQINVNEASLNSQIQQITQAQTQLNGLKNSGQISTYNASVDGYNQQVAAYDSLVNQTKTLIDNYDQLVAERNSIATAENKLTQSISSLPSTLPTQ